jgi:predicted nucleic acid-binding protein
VKEFARSIDNLDTFISVVTIGEIAKGIELLPEGRRRNSLVAWLREIEAEYGEQILPCDIEIARVWGELTGRAQRQGHTIAAADGLIAATAIYHRLSLATRNVRHFIATGVSLINPWED